MIASLSLVTSIQDSVTPKTKIVKGSVKALLNFMLNDKSPEKGR